MVLIYVRFPLSLRNVENLLFERGIDLSHETIRFWWNRFGPMFASEVRRRRVSYVPALGGVTLKDFALVIDRAPKVVGFAVNLHEDLSEGPAPVPKVAHTLTASLFRCRNFPRPHPLWIYASASTGIHQLPF